jgi:flagellar protein FliS
MPQAHPYSNYERTNVETADQRQLILMLYDGTIRFLQKAVAKIEGHDVEGAHNYLIRSRQIVSELLATLRPEKAGEVGQNLKQLYVYCFNRLVEANLTKDPELVREVVRILTTLREGWAGVKPAGQAESTAGGVNKRVDVRG